MKQNSDASTDMKIPGFVNRTLHKLTLLCTSRISIKQGCRLVCTYCMSKESLSKHNKSSFVLATVFQQICNLIPQECYQQANDLINIRTSKWQKMFILVTEYDANETANNEEQRYARYYSEIKSGVF